MPSTARTRKPRTTSSARSPSSSSSSSSASSASSAARPDLALDTPGPPPQVVLVLQGGGALGAYQVGVYQALLEAGIVPDWVIGTSIGAINAALIAGNRPEDRMARLNEFWQRVEQRWPVTGLFDWMGLGNLVPNLQTVSRGIPAFFTPNALAYGGSKAEVGVEAASYYSTAALRDTLRELVDFDYLCSCKTRMTVGAVNALSGHMRYFDNRKEPLSVEHVMASGALPPAFPAVRIDGEPYWDGGIYSNTPIEAVLDDMPRRDALIFAVNVWHQTGTEPKSIWQVMARQKDIQYASRADSHILRQKQLHRLRHVIRELHKRVGPEHRNDPEVRELASWGCGTTMHVAHLLAPRIEGEDHMKDIDFTSAGIHARRRAGHANTLEMIQRAPWKTGQADPIEGVIEHGQPA